MSEQLPTSFYASYHATHHALLPFRQRCRKAKHEIMTLAQTILAFIWIQLTSFIYTATVAGEACGYYLAILFVRECVAEVGDRIPPLFHAGIL